jgi:protein-tyrosine-phosphatase
VTETPRPAGRGAEAPRKSVLFVCVENRNRSQMAEAFARGIGGGRIEAFSAGSRPGEGVNPQAIESMREKGYDLSGQRSKALDELSATWFDAVVTMGCGDACPWIAAGRREDWQIPDPAGLAPDEFRKLRDLIEARVKALLASL